MPKLGEMDQLSRPFQIALVVVCLFAGVWFFALRGHSTSTTSSSSAPAATASAPAASKPASSAAASSSSTASVTARAKAEAKTGHIYHGPVPGLEGLTRDIARAHGAVAAIGATPSTPAATHSSSSATATAHHPAKTSAPAASNSTVKSQPIKAKSGAGSTPSRQVLVEDALHEGKIAVILFWNPKGTDDTVVNDQMKLLKAKRFAAFVSTASQVASYGSITRGVQVYGTPSVLIVNTRGQTTVLTGVQDAFSIEQAIDEARNS
jgi:cytoskeletal protein RodZ